LALLARSSLQHPSALQVTVQDQAAIHQVCDWLAADAYRQDAVLLTRCEWNSTYVPLLDPPLVDRSFIVSGWMTDEQLLSFMRTQHPRLLITMAGDEDLVHRVEMIGGVRVHSLLFQAGPYCLYGLSTAVR
jgi:hypothetical protein